MLISFELGIVEVEMMEITRHPNFLLSDSGSIVHCLAN